LAEFLGGLDVAIAADGRVVDQPPGDDLEAPLVGLGLAFQRCLLPARLAPAVEVLAVEEQLEAGLELELLARAGRHGEQQRQDEEEQNTGTTSHGNTSQGVGRGRGLASENLPDDLSPAGGQGSALAVVDLRVRVVAQTVEDRGRQVL